MNKLKPNSKNIFNDMQPYAGRSFLFLLLLILILIYELILNSTTNKDSLPFLVLIGSSIMNVLAINSLLCFACYIDL